MPRKKNVVAESEAPAIQADAEPTAGDLSQRPSDGSAPPASVAESGADAEAQGHGKNWGPPYKAIFTSSAKGFEMGENRRFKQRVFKFRDKPDPEVIAVLKDNGFTYRPEEKAWTIPADNASRLLSDQLAARFAGQSPDLSR